MTPLEAEEVLANFRRTWPALPDHADFKLMIPRCDYRATKVLLNRYHAEGFVPEFGQFCDDLQSLRDTRLTDAERETALAGIALMRSCLARNEGEQP